jgi:hypothetical protein
MPGKRRLTREALEALEAELRQRDEELAQRDEELAWRRDGATPEQMAVLNEKFDFLTPGVYRLFAELEAKRDELEARRAEKTLSTFQAEAAMKGVAADRLRQDAWMAQLAKSFVELRTENPVITDDDALDILIGPVKPTWPEGIWHPSRGRMKQGLTTLYKESRIPRRRRE